MKTAIKFLLVLSIPSLAFAVEPRLVIATGTCNHDVQPDRGSIVLTADYLENDLNLSIKNANAAYESAKADIQKLKLADAQLTTVEYTTQPQNDWEKGHNVFKGYRTRIGLRVATSDLRRLGEVIPAVARNHIKDIGQISAYLSNETLRNERGACLKEAVEDARSKAEKMAQGMGAALGPAMILRELSDDPGPMPRVMMANTAGRMADEPPGAPHFEPGKQSVQASVQASFEFSNK